MTIATYKWTIDRYHQAIDSGIFDGQNLELLRGDLILMPPEGEPHVYFSDRAAQILRSLLLGQAQVREGRPITLPNGSEPQPDLAIVQPLDTVYLALFCHSPESIIPNPCCISFYHKSPQLSYRSLNKASKLFEIRLVAIAFDF